MMNEEKVRTCKNCFGAWVGLITSKCPFCHVKDLETEVQRLEDEAVKVRGYIQNTAERTHIRIRQLEEKFSNSFGMVGERGRKINELNFEIKRLESEVISYRQNIAYMNDHASFQDNKIEEYKKQIDEFNSEIKRLEKGCRGYDDENQCLHDKLAESKREIDELNSEIKRLRNECQDYDKECRHWYGKFTGFERQTTKQKAEIKQLEKERCELKIRCTSFQNFCDDLRRLLNGNNSDDILVMVAQLKSTITNYWTSARYQNTKIKTYESRINELNSVIKRLKEERQMCSDCDKIERAKIEGLEKKLADKETKINFLRKTIDNYRGATKSDDAEIRVRGERINKLNTEIEKMAQTIVEYECKIEELEKRLATKENKIKGLETSCAWYGAICDKLRSMLDITFVSNLPYIVEKLKEKSKEGK